MIMESGCQPELAAYRSLFEWSWESFACDSGGPTQTQEGTVTNSRGGMPWAVVSISPLTAAMFQGGGIKAGRGILTRDSAVCR